MADVLRVKYRTPLDGELRAEMVARLVKYLLFMRGQTPCLYDELLRVVERAKRQERDEGPRRRRLSMNGAMKKAVKCVETAERLFGGQLDAIFACKVQRVALVFGSSLMIPREVVIVDFNVMETSAVDSPQTDEDDMSLEDSQMLTPPMSREKRMRLCAQKLIRELFARTMEQFSSALPTTKLHIAVLAERQVTRISGFLPKQQFKLRLPKERHGIRTHYVEICDGGEQVRQRQEGCMKQSNAGMNLTPANSNAEANLQSSAGLDVMWYVLEKPIAGFAGVINTWVKSKAH